MAGAGKVIAVDLDDAKLSLAARLGATQSVNAGREDPVQTARDATKGRGADIILESAGHPFAFQ